MDENPNTDAAFWLGLTFDFPDYAGNTYLPARPAGRGVCVCARSVLTLRMDDGTHVTCEHHEVRHVAEVPRVEPTEVKHETAVVYRDVGEPYKPINGWGIVAVTPVGLTRGTGTGGINQVAIILRRQVTS